MNVHFNRTIQNMCKFVFGSCFRTPAVKKKKQKKSDFLKLFSWGLGSSRTVPVHIYSASVTVQRHKMLAICACKYLSIFQNVAPFQHSQPQTPHDVIVGWLLQHSTRFQNQANVIGENNRVLRVQRVPHFDFGLTCDRELGFCLGNGFYHASACSQKDCYQQYPRQRCLDRKSKKKMTTDGLETDKSHSRMKG